MCTHVYQCCTPNKVPLYHYQCCATYVLCELQQMTIYYGSPVLHFIPLLSILSSWLLFNYFKPGLIQATVSMIYRSKHTKDKKNASWILLVYWNDTEQCIVYTFSIQMSSKGQSTPTMKMTTSMDISPFPDMWWQIFTLQHYKRNKNSYCLRTLIVILWFFFFLNIYIIYIIVQSNLHNSKTDWIICLGFVWKTPTFVGLHAWGSDKKKVGLLGDRERARQKDKRGNREEYNVSQIEFRQLILWHPQEEVLGLVRTCKKKKHNKNSVQPCHGCTPK